MNARPLSESDWLVSADPWAMLDCLFGTRSEGSGPDLPRKLRLYLTALGRKQWKRMPWAARTLLVVAEGMAEGTAPTETVYVELFNLAQQFAECDGSPKAVVECEQRLRELGFGGLVPASPPPRPLRPKDWADVTRLALVPLWRLWRLDSHILPRLHDADLIRDIFRHPDQPYRFAPAWRTGDVHGMAKGMYEAQDFSGMPMLADALFEAGCGDEDILAHCRADDRHVRGCWVVDLILDHPTDRDESSGPR
jgi:hypothetical protein